ncbi:MAG TPA: CHASE sensor domain-containing protein, partial [Myxococcota bacterium]|nr:CHASE sensor domain-containing protein [Myxococcota bacterium]
MIKRTPLRDLPLHKKLRHALMLTAGTALVLAFIVLGIGITYKLRSDTLTQLTTLTRAVALNLQAAVAFGDQTGSISTLGALRADPNIEFACVTRADGDKFVEYVLQRNHRHSCGERMDDAGWFIREITLAEPIVLDTERIGELRVVADVSDIWLDVLGFLAALAVLSAGALM